MQRRRLLRIMDCQQVRAPTSAPSLRRSGTRIACIMAKKPGTTGKCHAITMDKWENKRWALCSCSHRFAQVRKMRKRFFRHFHCLPACSRSNLPTIGNRSQSAPPRLATPRIGCLLRKRSHTQVARQGFGSASVSARLGFASIRLR